MSTNNKYIKEVKFMIRNRLSELLAERQLKISRVANDIPDLSRNTINSVANNKTKMIQMSTVDLLCQYLGVNPNEFFDYKPYDINVKTNINDNCKFISNDNYIASIDASYPEVYFENVKIEIFLNMVIVRENKIQYVNTFELVAIPENKLLVAPLKITQQEKDEMDEYVEDIREYGYSFIDNRKKNYNSEMEVLLENGSDKDKSEKFFKMWHNLGAGFQSILKDNISENVNKTIIREFNEHNKNNKKPVDFSEVENRLNFSFHDVNDFENKKNNPGEINFTDEDLPF